MNSKKKGSVHTLSALKALFLSLPLVGEISTGTSMEALSTKRGVPTSAQSR